MISLHPLRSPLLAALGVTGALGLLAVPGCSDAASQTVSSPYARHASSGSGTGSGSSAGAGTSGTGAPAAGNGDTSGAAGNNTGNNAAGGSSSGASGGSGSGSSSGGAPPPPVVPAFDVLLDNAAPSVALADTTVVQVTVAPQSWTGAVTLSVTNLPADVTATFDNPTINVSGTTATTAKLTLKSLTSTAPAATPFSVIGTAGQTVHNVAATVTVKPELTITIPVNVDSNNPGFGTITVKAPADLATNPVIVNFVNLDSTPHEIHAGNKSGFNHGKGTFGQNQADAPVRKVTAKGTFGFYLHDENNPQQNPGTLVIQ